MSLIRCPECGKENVSSFAVACPNCGFNISASQQNVEQTDQGYNQQPVLQEQNYQETEISQYPHVDMKDSYVEYVYKLYKAGVLTGNDEKGTFAPLSNITRAESAAIVTRMVDENSRRKVTLMA